MVFSSITFLFYFLPCVLVLYYLVPSSMKNLILFFSSLFFYAWGEPVYVSIMLFSTVLDYCCGRLIEKFRGRKLDKFILLLSICTNLGMLGIFKYNGMITRIIYRIFHYTVHFHLALPVGISFYTFQTMSYTIDVYRGKVPAQKNIVNFGTFVSLFPQLIAGPIVRYEEIAKELTGRSHSKDQFADGIRRFVCGLAKKVLLANNIGMLWETISDRCIHGQGSVCMAWIGLIAYGFQVYYDFSGYSDMAIGLGSMFGFHFPDNFRYPFCAKNITDFWRRWHMTLGGWFRDYVYIPLGGNRCGKFRQIVNIFIVWFLTGLWHGASWNFVFWGLYFGMLLFLEKTILLRVLNKLPGIVQHGYASFLITISWVLFAFPDRGNLFKYFSVMFGRGNVPVLNQECLYLVISYVTVLILCIFGAGPFMKNMYEKAKGKLPVWSITTVELGAIMMAMLVCMIYLVSSTYNPFLYFRF